MQSEFIKYQLDHSSPEFIFKWLSDNKNNFLDYWDDNTIRDSIEKQLLAKNNKLIDLGLALYGSNIDVAYELFSTHEKEIQLAVCSGKAFGNGIGDGWLSRENVWPKLLDVYSDNSDKFNEDKRPLIKVLLQNENIPDSILENFFLRKDQFNELKDDLWIKLLGYVVDNKRLSKPYVEEFMDGYSKHLYHAVFDSAWNVVAKVPVNIKNSFIIQKLCKNLVPRTWSCNVDELVNLWRSQDENEDKYYSKVRLQILRLIDTYTDEFRDFENSDEEVFRSSFYLRVSNVSCEKVDQWFKKDCTLFLDHALNNPAFYQNTYVRNSLSRKCWDAPDPTSSMIYPNIFKGREELYIKKHPEWFKDEYTKDIPFDEIVDYHERVEKRIEHLDFKLRNIEENILVYDFSVIDNKVEDILTLQDQANTFIYSSLGKFRNLMTIVVFFLGIAAGIYLQRC